LLPTVVSRCQQVAFSPVPIKAISEDLHARFGLDPEKAGLLARAAGGNLSYARELATSESARRQREQLLDMARDLPVAGLWATQAAVDELMNTVERRAAERVKALDIELQKALEWAGDARTKAWLKKRHEEKIKRQQRRLTTQGLYAVTRTYAGWYRDLAAVSVGAEDAVLNQDRLGELREQASADSLVGYTRAVLAVHQTQERLRYNVDARCAIGDMFRTIKEALAQWPML
jgi:DNA polymerase-3 subunit delta'